MIEQWRPIPGFPGYEVSSMGNVRCWRPRNRLASAPTKPRLVKRVVNSHRRAVVSLSVDGHVKARLVQQLVLEAFVGPRPEGSIACHVENNDTLDLRVENLRWGTPKENQADRERHGTSLRGSQVSSSKLTEASALEIYASTGTHEALASRFGVNRKVVSLIKSGQAWTHATGAKRSA